MMIDDIKVVQLNFILFYHTRNSVVQSIKIFVFRTKYFLEFICIRLVILENIFWVFPKKHK